MRLDWRTSAQEQESKRGKPTDTASDKAFVDQLKQMQQDGRTLDATEAPQNMDDVDQVFIKRTMSTELFQSAAW